MKAMKPTIKYLTLYPDESEDRINELEREVAELQRKLKNKKDDASPNVTDLLTVNRMQRDFDLMEINLRRQKRKRQALEKELELAKIEAEMLTKALNSPALKEENLVEMMMQQLEMRTEELHMSRTLIMEMQNVAFADSQDKLVTQAKSVLYENNYLKKKLMDMEVEMIKNERKLLETTKHSDQVDRVHEKKTQLLSLCKKKLQEAEAEKESALEDLQKKWEKKEAKRLTEQENALKVLEIEINDLQARTHMVSLGNGVTLPPLSPHGQDSILIAELRKEIQVRDNLLAEMNDVHSDGGVRSEKSGSSGKGKNKNKKMARSRIAEQARRLSLLEGQIEVLQEELKTTKEVSTEELTALRNQNKKMASLLKNLENDASYIVTLETQIQEKTDFFEKELSRKNEGMQKLQSSLKVLTKTMNDSSDSQTRLTDMCSENRLLKKEIDRLTKDYQAEVVKRKRFYNLCEELKGKIRVFVRVRPLLNEIEAEHSVCLKFLDEYSLEMSPNQQRPAKDFTFDRVFQPTDNQEQVFESVSHLMQTALDGFNVSIMAYGQTGSGKTFTLLGDDARPGIAPRSFQKLFDIISTNKDQYTTEVSFYMLELYNDKLLDLLVEGEPKEPVALEIKKDNKNTVYVQGAVVRKADNADQLLSFFKQGISSRHIAETKMNKQSSRSHLIMTIVTESTSKISRHVFKGKLSIIDLAGSERLPKSGIQTEQLKEASSINLSLSALGDVISALTSEQAYVPYRNSKLTMLIQDSLGGNAKTLMFVNTSPSAYNESETLNSLSYGARVKLVKNVPLRQFESEELINLRNEMERLKKELKDSNSDLLQISMTRPSFKVSSKNGHSQPKSSLTKP